MTPTDPQGAEGRETRVRLFSNGSEWASWAHYNCDHCTKQRPCELEQAIGLAYFTDGTAPLDVAERLGITTDGYDVRCSEREPTPALAAYDAQRATLPQWTITRKSDGFTPVDGVRWSVDEARKAIANWNNPFSIYTITRHPLGGTERE